MMTKINIKGFEKTKKVFGESKYLFAKRGFV